MIPGSINKNLAERKKQKVFPVTVSFSLLSRLPKLYAQGNTHELGIQAPRRGASTGLPGSCAWWGRTWPICGEGAGRARGCLPGGGPRRQAAVVAPHPECWSCQEVLRRASQVSSPCPASSPFSPGPRSPISVSGHLLSYLKCCLFILCGTPASSESPLPSPVFCFISSEVCFNLVASTWET